MLNTKNREESFKMDDQDSCRQVNDNNSQTEVKVQEAVNTIKEHSSDTNNIQLEVSSNIKDFNGLNIGDDVKSNSKEESNKEICCRKDVEMEVDQTETPADGVVQICVVSDTQAEQNKLENIVNEGIIAQEKNYMEVKVGKENFSGENADSHAETENNQSKNYQSVILEDWEVDAPQGSVNQSSEPCQFSGESKGFESIAEKNLNNSVLEKTESECIKSKNQSPTGTINLIHRDQEENLNLENISFERKIETLKIPKLISKKEIVKILGESSERVVKPIVAAKDLFFSIELTKRLNEKLSQNKSSKIMSGEKSSFNDSCNNNNNVDDRQKIVQILESEDVSDWQSVPNKSSQESKENGSDMEIKTKKEKAIKIIESVDASTFTSQKNASHKPPKKNLQKKIKILDKELEKSLALQQLREEFPITRKRLRTTKKVKHIPFLASTVLEKAMTSVEVSSALKPGPPKRRPCYMPDNLNSAKNNEINNMNKLQKAKAKVEQPTENVLNPDFELGPTAVVKTYSVKRKSTDTESEIKSTIAAVTKALSESTVENTESKPKKQKTATKPENKPRNNDFVDKKKKSISGNDKKRNSELEKLLGDEGAVRMLYDTQHGSSGGYPAKKLKHRTTTGLKKDLVLKTKLVKNAVMRLSGVGAEGVALRGKRRSLVKGKAGNTKQEEPLFTSTPNIVLYKPKKKQRAEASRILYRHSSSESFVSSEGCRRKSLEKDSLTTSTNIVNDDKSQDFTIKPGVTEIVKPKKSEIIIKRKVKKIEKPQRILKTKDKSSKNSYASSKLVLSNVPVRKSSRPRTVSKKYSVWSSTSMDCLSVESLGLKKLKKASNELGKKLNLKELNILQYEHLVQVILAPSSTFLKNSLDNEVLQELIQVFSYLSEYENCKAVLLSSQGSTFCQGIDINKIISFNDDEKEKEVSALIRGIREFVKCLSEFKKPVIAGVNGAAIGLGATILPFFDLVVSSEKAFFYTPYVKLGQTPEGAPTHTFPRLNRLLISELLLKSHKLTATDALKYGLVTQVIPQDRFEEELIVLARSIAAQPTQGIQSIKFLLRTIDQDEIDEILRAEGELLEEQWNNEECISNMIKLLNSGEFQLKHVDSKE